MITSPYTEIVYSDRRFSFLYDKLKVALFNQPQVRISSLFPLSDVRDCVFYDNVTRTTYFDITNYPEVVYQTLVVYRRNQMRIPEDEAAEYDPVPMEMVYRDIYTYKIRV